MTYKTMHLCLLRMMTQSTKNNRSLTNQLSFIEVLRSPPRCPIRQSNQHLTHRCSLCSLTNGLTVPQTTKTTSRQYFNSKVLNLARYLSDQRQYRCRMWCSWFKALHTEATQTRCIQELKEAQRVQSWAKYRAYVLQGQTNMREHSISKVFVLLNPT